MTSKKPSILAFCGLILLLGASLALTDRYFLRQNKGFCQWQIYSRETTRKLWDEKTFSSVSSDDLQTIFKRPFTYLSKGHQSVAFESSDGQYVLKFYRFPTHMRPLGWMYRPISRFSQKRMAIWEYNKAKFSETRESHLLAFSEFGKESGLIAIHMDKSFNCPYIAQIKDPLGMGYEVLLKDTYFLVQRKGSLFFPTLDAYVKAGKISEAQEVIYNTISFIMERSKKRIKDEDAILEKNYGLVGTHLFQLDTGRLHRESSLSNFQIAKNDAVIITEPLKNWLQAVSPELLQYYQDILEKI